VLERALARETAAQWLAENRAAIEAYNRGIESRGVWSDGWRRW
jgi:post-segregation antitoxin (ccd killing protein)